MITSRLACRQNGRFSLSVTRAYRSFFEIGATFNAQWCEDALLLERVENGPFAVKEPTSYRHDDYVRQIEFTPGGCDLPGFHVDNAILESMGSDIMCWERPPIWQLPWCSRPSQQGDVGIDLKKRLDSAHRREVDPLQVTARVPQWARDQLDWHAFMKDIFSKRRVA